MEKHIQIITDLSLKLDELSDSSGYILEKLELAIGCCKTALEQMREFVLQEGFPDQKSEIHFFKKLKPSVNSKLIYYLQVFDIQSKLPIADDQKVIQYLKKRIDRIHEFTLEYQAEVQYFQCGFIHFDKNYFTRGDTEIPLPKRNLNFLVDEQFNSWHDHTFSKIIANQMLTIYIQDEIKKLEGNEKNPQLKLTTTLKWTGYKIYVYEIIYGMYLTGMINQGNANLQTIARSFEQLLGIELNDIYGSFSEMKKRKIDRTKFLDMMKSMLENKMDESDLE